MCPIQTTFCARSITQSRRKDTISCALSHIPVSLPHARPIRNVPRAHHRSSRTVVFRLFLLYHPQTILSVFFLYGISRFDHVGAYHPLSRGTRFCALTMCPFYSPGLKPRANKKRKSRTCTERSRGANLSRA